MCETHSGAIERKEIRPKVSHGTDIVGSHDHPSLHESMLSNVMDCEALIAGGMGRPMSEALRRSGIEPFLTERTNVDDAVEAYVHGVLVNHQERLH